MIVVVGIPAWSPGPPTGPAGRACAIALAAAARGAPVQLVGRAGDDSSGDALMIALAAAGVGHIALLRDPARPTPVLPTPRPDAARDEDAPRLLEDEEDPPVTAGIPPAPVLEPADVSLGLRYITSYSVVIVTDDAGPGVVPVAAEAAAFTAAHLVVLVGEGGAVPGDVPATATVLAAPADDPDGAFAALVGAYGAALDAGVAPDDAFAAARGAWERPDP